MAQASEPVIHRSCFVGVNIQRELVRSPAHTGFRKPSFVFYFRKGGWAVLPPAL